MTIKSRVSGEMAQMVTCQLDAGQTVCSDANKYRWKTVNVSIETRLSTPGAKADEPKKSGGFLANAIGAATEVAKRANRRPEPSPFQWFRATGGSGLVGLCRRDAWPGPHRRRSSRARAGSGSERHAFICAEQSVNFDIAYNGLSQGHRSGEGLFLEHFTGEAARSSSPGAARSSRSTPTTTAARSRSTPARWWRSPIRCSSGSSASATSMRRPS